MKPETINKIREHYEHAREKHPYFCDGLLPTQVSSDWYTLDEGIKSKKEARCFVRDCKEFDKENGLKIKYRIVKQTIKQEVVK